MVDPAVSFARYAAGLDVELDACRGRQVADLVRGLVRIPWRDVHRVVGEQVRIHGQHITNRGDRRIGHGDVLADEGAGVGSMATKRSW